MAGMPPERQRARDRQIARFGAVRLGAKGDSCWGFGLGHGSVLLGFGVRSFWVGSSFFSEWGSLFLGLGVRF